MVNHQALIDVSSFIFCFVEKVLYYLDKFFCQSIRLGVMWGTDDVIHCILFHESGKCFGNIAWSIVTY